MLGFISSPNEPSGAPATPATPSSAASPAQPPELEKKETPKEVQSTPGPSSTATEPQASASQPVSLAVSPPTPPATQTSQPVQSPGTQTLRSQTPPSPSAQRPAYSQSRSLSAPAPAHFLDSPQSAVSPGQHYPAGPIRRSSRGDHLPPLPESVNLPPPVRTVLPSNAASGSYSRNGGDSTSDSGSREDLEPASVRVRTGSGVTQSRMSRYTGYDEKESITMDKEKAYSNGLSRRTTLVDHRNSSIPFLDHQNYLKIHSTSKKTLGDRLKDTRVEAERQKDVYKAKAQRQRLIQNVAMGAQVLLGSLVTGLSAVGSGTNKNTSTATAVLGGISTVVASYVAKIRGSNEPELSITRTKDLEQFIRECDAFTLDYGHIVVEDDHDPASRNLELELFALRDRFEELLGNANGERKLSPSV